MTITPELIDAYKKIIEDPGQYGFSFKPLKECFALSDDAYPKHLLFESYVAYIDKPIPKLIFYIIMDDLYAQASASNGDLGYKVKLIV